MQAAISLPTSTLWTSPPLVSPTTHPLLHPIRTLTPFHIVSMAAWKFGFMCKGEDTVFQLQMLNIWMRIWMRPPLTVPVGGSGANPIVLGSCTPRSRAAARQLACLSG